MQVSELERLGRMESQIDGIREDVTEIKSGMKENTKDLSEAVKEFTAAIANLHKDFLLRQEADKLVEQRDKERDETKGRIDELDKRTSKLERWRSWSTGAGAVILIGLGVFEAFIQAGVVK